MPPSATLQRPVVGAALSHTGTHHALLIDSSWAGTLEELAPSCLWWPPPHLHRPQSARGLLLAVFPASKSAVSLAPLSRGGAASLSHLAAPLVSGPGALFCELAELFRHLDARTEGDADACAEGGITGDAYLDALRATFPPPGADLLQTESLDNDAEGRDREGSSPVEACSVAPPFCFEGLSHLGSRPLHPSWSIDVSSPRPLFLPAFGVATRSFVVPRTLLHPSWPPPPPFGAPLSWSPAAPMACLLAVALPACVLVVHVPPTTAGAFSKAPGPPSQSTATTASAASHGAASPSVSRCPLCAPHGATPPVVGLIAVVWVLRPGTIPALRRLGRLRLATGAPQMLPRSGADPPTRCTVLTFEAVPASADTPTPRHGRLSVGTLDLVLIGAPPRNGSVAGDGSRAAARAMASWECGSAALAVWRHPELAAKARSCGVMAAAPNAGEMTPADDGEAVSWAIDVVLGVKSEADATAEARTDAAMAAARAAAGLLKSRAISLHGAALTASVTAGRRSTFGWLGLRFNRDRRTVRVDRRGVPRVWV